MEGKFFVYYLFSASLNKYYIGKTNNLARRTREHENGEEVYTKNGSPWSLIGYIECQNPIEAYHLEKKLKKSKNKKYTYWYIKQNGTTLE